MGAGLTIKRAALLVGSFAASVVLLTGSARAAEAMRPPKAIATSTQVFSSPNSALAGDTRISWYSGDGTTAVFTTENATGQVTSIEKIEYSLHDHRRSIVQTVLFPEQRAWATFDHSSICLSDCYVDNFLYASPTLTARLLASHQLVIVGQPQTIDGRTAVEVTSPSSGVVAWVNPTKDEVLTYQFGPSAPVQTFNWLPATRANLDKLRLNAPRGYKRAASSCADTSNPIPPGSGFSGCPALP
jgi:hypothetical protein